MGKRVLLQPGSSGLLPHETRFYNHYIQSREPLEDSYSQLGHDLWAHYLTRGTGYFVEFGAYDGLHLSNTYYLERHGWKGIIAEPNPELHQQCLANRQCVVDPRCVWSKSGETLEFNTVDGASELGTLAAFETSDMHGGTRSERNRNISVTTVSLSDLLEEHNAPRTIDYMSVDTEGSELDILEAFDFKTYTVRILSVEHNYTKQRRLIERLLKAQGLSRLPRSVDYFDDLYLLDDDVVPDPVRGTC